MVYWKRATDSKPRFQFESSSGTLGLSQIFNCGPTGAAQQADYYNNSPRLAGYSIEGGRLKAGIAQGRPTSAWEQAEILRRRGVPCEVVVITGLLQLDELLGYGRRPIGIGVEMSRVTAATRGHSFTGWHRITLLTRGHRIRNGKKVSGYVYTDPNFHPIGSGGREDPRKGHRFISRAELRHAYIDNIPRYAIVPNHKKGEG
jgi:hypothetical protein